MQWNLESNNHLELQSTCYIWNVFNVLTWLKPLVWPWCIIKAKHVRSRIFVFVVQCCTNVWTGYTKKVFITASYISYIYLVVILCMGFNASASVEMVGSYFIILARLEWCLHMQKIADFRNSDQILCYAGHTWNRQLTMKSLFKAELWRHGCIWVLCVSKGFAMNGWQSIADYQRKSVKNLQVSMYRRITNVAKILKFTRVRQIMTN